MSEISVKITSAEKVLQNCYGAIQKECHSQNGNF